MPMLVEIVQENTVLNVVDVLLYDLFFEKGIAILFDIQLCPLFSLHWLKSGDLLEKKSLCLEKKVIFTFIIRHKCKIDMENLSQNL